MKKVFEDDLISGMQQELRKQASEEVPNLSKAAECLHTALEIFEEQGMTARADQVLQLLENINRAPAPTVKKAAKIHSLQQLMEAGVTQRDLREFKKNNPMAIAKLNLTLRRLGLSDHEVAKYLGPNRVMSEEMALKALSPNHPSSLLEFESLAPVSEPSDKGGELLEFKSSLAASKKKVLSDRHTKGLTPNKSVSNYKKHGTPFNMADDNCAIDLPPPSDNLNVDDWDVDFADILNSPTFDIDASDDELMLMEVKEDSLEVLEAEVPMEDFEDERD